MKILVSGATGFLGHHVVPELQRRDHELSCPNKGRMRLSSYGVDDEIHSFKPDVFVHLAAVCGGIGANRARPADFWSENLLMGLDVIRACAESNTKLVFLGTTCSYPKFAPIPFSEDDVWRGYPEETNAPYGLAKRVLGEGLAAYERQYGLRSAYLIPTNMYGEHDHFDLETGHVIPTMIRKFIDAKKSGEPPTLWGDGTPTRDFLYAGDCAEAIAEACERQTTNAQPINLGNGSEIAMAQLAELIMEILDYRIAPIWDATKPNGQPRRALNTTRAAERLNWRAKTPLIEGLKKTIAWYVAR